MPFFGRNTIKSLRDKHDAMIITAHEAVQELNKIIDGLPMRYYLAFPEVSKKPRALAMLDDYFVPVVRAEPAAPPKPTEPPAKTPLEKIKNGLEARHDVTIEFDGLEVVDNSIILSEVDAPFRRAVLSPTQLMSLLMAVDVSVLNHVIEVRHDEFAELHKEPDGIWPPSEAPDRYERESHFDVGNVTIDTGGANITAAAGIGEGITVISHKSQGRPYPADGDVGPVVEPEGSVIRGSAAIHVDPLDELAIVDKTVRKPRSRQMMKPRDTDLPPEPKKLRTKKST